MQKYIESSTILDLKWKKTKLFYFSKWLILHIREIQDTLRGYSIFLHFYLCFYRDEIAAHDIYYIRGKRNALSLATFWESDNSKCFDIPVDSTEMQVLYSFNYKSEDGYHNFLFSFYFLIFF